MRRGVSRSHAGQRSCRQLTALVDHPQPEEVINRPDIDTNRPVSRQYRAGRLGVYEYPTYWSTPGFGSPLSLTSAIGPELNPVATTAPGSDETRTRNARADAQACVEENRRDDPHLRSAKAVMNYHLHAIDGDVGKLQGLLVDEKTWAIRYLVVNTSAGWLGHQTLLAPEWIEGIDWSEATVVVNVSREAIKSAPAFNPATTLDREFEVNIYRHYRRDEYWPHGTQREDLRAGL
jgi:hypothetical protein